MKIIIYNLLILICIFSYSCATRKISRNGVLVPYNQAMRDDFQKCERAKLEKKYNNAKICLNSFIKDFKDSSLIDSAYYILGDIYFQENDFQKAMQYFKTIVTSYQNSPLLPEASFSLASSYYQLGDYRKSYIVLNKINKNKVTPTLLLKVYYLLAKNAQLSNANYSAVVWYMSARELTKRQSNIIKINNEIIKIIEEKLSRDELISLADKYNQQFPSAYINYKLGKDFYKGLKPDQAKFYLDKFLKDKELDHLESKYISDAGDILARIDSHNKIVKNRIGIILPLSGKFESFGQKALRGIELAAGIYHNRTSAFDVELIVIDNKSDASIATEAVTNLLYNYHVAGLIGPLLASTAPNVAKACEKVGLPNISLSQRSGIPEAGDYTFRLALTNTLQINTLAKYAIEKLGITKFAILHSTDDYGLEMSQLFWDEVLKYGGEVTDVESYKPAQTDFKNEIAKISGRFYLEARMDEYNELRSNFETRMGRKPRSREIILPPNISFEAVFIPSFPKTIGQIAPAFSYGDIEGTTLLGTNGWNSSNLIDRGGEYVEGAIFVDGFFNNSPYSIVKDFSSNFYNTFGEQPGIVEAHAYDAADIMINLMAQDKIKTRLDLRNALAAIVDFPGVTGSISFSETGDAEKSLFILTVENGKIIQVN